MSVLVKWKSPTRGLAKVHFKDDRESIYSPSLSPLPNRSPFLHRLLGPCDTKCSPHRDSDNLSFSGPGTALHSHLGGPAEALITPLCAGFSHLYCSSSCTAWCSWGCLLMWLFRLFMLVVANSQLQHLEKGDERTWSLTGRPLRSCCAFTLIA